MPSLAPLQPRSLSFYHSNTDGQPSTSMSQEHVQFIAGEREPLLPGRSADSTNKPFYRPRPLWIVPFAITAAVVRGMTVAPRVEVYTQLSCKAAQHHKYNHTSLSIFRHASYTTSVNSSLDLSTQDSAVFRPTILLPLPIQDSSSDMPDEELDPRILPTKRCLSNPVVQAGAARLQTIMTITMGGLSALTTGWWGRFGERFGRTRVLAIATLGLLLSDLIFILVSTPHSPLATHGHKLLILAPLFEGLLGGWSSLQCGTSAYLSDCTSAGSRARLFSRFAGAIHLGTAFGPIVGAFLMGHPVLGVAPRSVTEVFWVAITFSFVNFLLVLFVFPESLSRDTRYTTDADVHGKGKARAPLEDIEESPIIDDVTETRASGKVIESFWSPLTIFLPVTTDGPGRRRTRDWSLTFLACGLFACMISLSVSHVRYLYAGHVYGWGAVQLGYYISLLGGARALNLLVIFPFIISTFKPSLQAPVAKPKTKSKKMITKARLAREIDFDLQVAWYSLLIDFASHLLVLLSPSPTDGRKQPKTGMTFAQPFNSEGQTKFVLFSALTSLGSGSLPAIQSLALCIAQARTVSEEGDGQGTTESGEVDVGRLFGSLAVLQAVGQTILGPVLFGIIYSETVATYPKAIFVTAAAMLLGAMVFISLAKPEEVSIKSKRRMKRWEREEAERGRSRVRKDLRRGGATLGTGMMFFSPNDAHVGHGNIMVAS